MLEWWQLIVLALVGGIAGFLNVIAGGGSLLSMPVMLIMGLDGTLANGTNRLAILCQNISGAISFYRHGIHHLRTSFLLAACTLPGAVLGAFLGTHFGGVWFARFLAAIMVIMLILMLRSGNTSNKTSGETSRKRLVVGCVLLAFVGLYGGIVQAGVGYLLILVLNRVIGYDLVKTNAHKVIIIASYTVPALIIFASKSEVLWIPAAMLAFGNAVGAWLGAAFAVKKGDRMIRLILLITMSFITILLLWRSV